MRYRGAEARVCQMDPARGKPWTHRIHARLPEELRHDPIDAGRGELAVAEAFEHHIEVVRKGARNLVGVLRR